MMARAIGILLFLMFLQNLAMLALLAQIGYTLGVIASKMGEQDPVGEFLGGIKDILVTLSASCIERN